MQTLPFGDPIVVIEVDRETLWSALRVPSKPDPLRKGELFHLPGVGQVAHSQLRRFPIVSGFRVTWDSSRPTSQWVFSIHLALNQEDSNHDGPFNQKPGGLDGLQVLNRSRERQTDEHPCEAVLTRAASGSLRLCWFLLKCDTVFRLSMYQQVHSPGKQARSLMRNVSAKLVNNNRMGRPTGTSRKSSIAPRPEWWRHSVFRVENIWQE